MKKKSEIEIGRRAFQEVTRLFNKIVDAQIALGMKSNQLLYEWMNGGAPSARYLQRLYFLGADIEYILTGRKSQK